MNAPGQCISQAPVQSVAQPCGTGRLAVGEVVGQLGRPLRRESRAAEWITAEVRDAGWPMPGLADCTGAGHAIAPHSAAVSRDRRRLSEHRPSGMVSRSLLFGAKPTTAHAAA